MIGFKLQYEIVKLSYKNETTQQDVRFPRWFLVVMDYGYSYNTYDLKKSILILNYVTLNFRTVDVSIIILLLYTFISKQ